MSTNLLSKKVIIVAIIAVSAVSAFLVASSIAQATAQQQKMMWTGEGMPQINGSVSVADEASNFINENVKVPFVEAAQTAQGQVDDGRVLGGHLGVVQGYLVYTFFVANTGNQTGLLVIVDAGNGDVLYISEGQSFGSFGPMYGPWGGHGYGGWHGPWKGYDWGMWR
jgi:uncharacterized membrane protein YkoI